VANTDFEGGDDDHGCGYCIFLVIYAQPSHTHKKRFWAPQWGHGDTIPNTKT
jgi:hypothetical protein